MFICVFVYKLKNSSTFTFVEINLVNYAVILN